MNIFLKQFQELYGLENMLYNSHTLQHLADCVDLSYSNFPFENNKGKLIRYVNSPTFIEKVMPLKRIILFDYILFTFYPTLISPHKKRTRF